MFLLPSLRSLCSGIQFLPTHIFLSCLVSLKVIHYFHSLSGLTGQSQIWQVTCYVIQKVASVLAQFCADVIYFVLPPQNYCFFQNIPLHRTLNLPLGSSSIWGMQYFTSSANIITVGCQIVNPTHFCVSLRFFSQIVQLKWLAKGQLFTLNNILVSLMVRITYIIETIITCVTKTSS